MLGALTSLTGGGGMSASSSATATNGDFSGGAGGYSVGNMTFNGNQKGSANGVLALLAFAIVGYVIIKKVK